MFSKLVSSFALLPVVFALLAVCLSSFLVFVPALWRFSRHVITLVHEVFHSIFMLASGRLLLGVKLHKNSSGEALSSGSSFSMFFVLLMGYPGPSVLGFVVLLLALQGFVLEALLVLFTMLFLLLLQVRNLFALFMLVLSSFIMCGVCFFCPLSVQFFVVFLLAFFFLFGGFFDAVLLFKNHSVWVSSDAEPLARFSRLPAGLWVFYFLLMTTAGIISAGVLFTKVYFG